MTIEPKHLAPATGTSAGTDTTALMRTGGGCLAVGGVSALLMLTVFGGVSRQGPHTNSGWLALIITMMCTPFGTMLFALGLAKWLGHRKASRNARNLPA